jgi:SNF2 family DNA or RNA helicase
MGLGKTVQAIAFLCLIAEKYCEFILSLINMFLISLCICFSAIWGPFLVISPASTLHNWQQEFARFVPKFKVIPYWGNPQVSLMIYNKKVKFFMNNKQIGAENIASILGQQRCSH